MNSLLKLLSVVSVMVAFAFGILFGMAKFRQPLVTNDAMMVGYATAGLFALVGILTVYSLTMGRYRITERQASMK